MKYFLLHSDPFFTDTPEILDWSGKIDPRDICPSQSYRIKNRQIFEIRPNPNLVFIDVLTSPFLLLSKVCMETIRLYEPKIKAKQIILLDTVTPQRKTYYLPILQSIHCLTDGSEWNLDKSILRKGVLDLSQIKDASIFQLADLKTKYTVIRMDVLESILKREVRGIGITPLEALKGDI